MSSNNVVYNMKHKGLYHVFHWLCMDNIPSEPDYENRFYKRFMLREKALVYAFNVVKTIEDECDQDPMGVGLGVEYGVCEI